MLPWSASHPRNAREPTLPRPSSPLLATARAATLAAALAWGSVAADAQQVRGMVTDSASGGPIPGAVLQLLDSAGGVRGRTISDQRGAYTLRLPVGAVRVRALRIGFRPRFAELPAAPAGDVRVDLAMPRIPAFVEPIRVVAAQCGRRSDRGSALALLEQARAGLLTTVVSREANPASVTRYRIERAMEGTSDRVARQVVRVDSADRAGSSFGAVHDAEAFVRRGFRDEEDGDLRYFAPDAEVLLDDRFAAGYCFRVMPRDPRRPHQVGLGFEAADRRPGRVDIDGALWIDTVARELRDIEFKYAGIDARGRAFEPGGRISFRAMENGVVLVDRWHLSLLGVREDTLPGPRNLTLRIRYSYMRRDTGGELARAEWPDGTSWRAPLGRLEGRATVRGGAPARGVLLALPGTPYRTTTDTSGRFVVEELVPGPYGLTVVDADLLTIGLAIPTRTRFTSDRDTTRLTLELPTAEDFVIEQCRASKRYDPAADRTFLLARALTPAGAPIEDVRWTVRMFGREGWDDVAVDGRTGSDGLMPQCRNLTRGAQVEILATPPGGLTQTIRRQLTGAVNIVPIVLDR